eukprot:GILJ01023372.1.p1 GENE.GILJ01023372.1~~GILJ01023372.1.p1  ORF type:complete len:335 (+),score=55.16 GILJ01023372.1:52-1056(+)
MVKRSPGAQVVRLTNKANKGDLCKVRPTHCPMPNCNSRGNYPLGPLVSQADERWRRSLNVRVIFVRLYCAGVKHVDMMTFGVRETENAFTSLHIQLDEIIAAAHMLMNDRTRSVYIRVEVDEFFIGGSKNGKGEQRVEQLCFQSLIGKALKAIRLVANECVPVERILESLGNFSAQEVPAPIWLEENDDKKKGASPIKYQLTGEPYCVTKPKEPTNRAIFAAADGKAKEEAKKKVSEVTAKANEIKKSERLVDKLNKRQREVDSAIADNTKKLHCLETQQRKLLMSRETLAERAEKEMEAVDKAKGDRSAALSQQMPNNRKGKGSKSNYSVGSV